MRLPILLILTAVLALLGAVALLAPLGASIVVGVGLAVVGAGALVAGILSVPVTESEPE